ncbi:MAG: hypothetical protein D6714_16645, partial [Bacteroidetes bacterium]
ERRFKIKIKFKFKSKNKFDLNFDLNFARDPRRQKAGRIKPVVGAQNTSNHLFLPKKLKTPHANPPFQRHSINHNL